MRFTARLSAAAAVDGDGDRCRREGGLRAGRGTGQAVDWTWDASAAAPGAYAWTIATAGARAAAGTLGRTATLAVTRMRAEPAAVTPNGDGIDDATTISYILGAPATVTATLVDSGGATVATLFSEPRAAGEQSFSLTAENVPGRAPTRSSCPRPGATAAPRRPASRVLVNRTLSAFAARARLLAERRRPRSTRCSFTFTLAQPATVRLRILRDGKWIATAGDGDVARARAADARVGRDEAGRAAAERALPGRAHGHRCRSGR